MPPRQDGCLKRPIFANEKVHLETTGPMNDVERGTAADRVLDHRQADVVILSEGIAKSRFFAGKRLYCDVGVFRETRLAKQGTRPGTTHRVGNLQTGKHGGDRLNDLYVLLVMFHSSPP